MYNSNFRRSDEEFAKTSELRINFQIRVQKVRLTRNEEQLGIVSTDEARRMAEDDGLDLVEIVPQANPPICKIMDYGKYKYEKKMKDKDAAKKQRESQMQTKEIRLRPSIAIGDEEIKINQAKNFLLDGFKVQLILQFKGREMHHQDAGMSVVQRMAIRLSLDGLVEIVPKIEGKKIVCCIAPKQR